MASRGYTADEYVPAHKRYEPGEGPASRRAHIKIAADAARRSRSRQILHEAMVSGNRGRPRKFEPFHFFTLAYLTALDARPLHLTQIYATFCGLTKKQRRKLALRKDVTYDQVTHFVVRVEELVELGHVEIVDLMNGIFDATVPTSGAVSLAVDSTDYPSPARIRAFWNGRDPAPTNHDDPEAPADTVPRRPRNSYPVLGPDQRLQRTADPDARDGHRSAHNGLKAGPFVGYDATFLVNTRQFGAPDPVPAFIAGANLTPAGSHHAKAALKTLDLLRERVAAITDAVADRAYNTALPQFWTKALRDRDIDPVFDLTVVQRRPRLGKTEHTVLIDGTLFTSALPERLRKLPSHHDNMSSDEHKALAHRYEQRLAYAFTPMGKKSSTGKARFRGPIRADTTDSPIRCPNTPRSMRAPQDRPTTLCTPGQPCGCRKTVTLDNDYYPNLRQRHPYGTTEWLADYHRRNLVETANSQIRLPRGLARGYTRVFGQIKNSFLIGFTIFAHNHKCIVDFFHARKQPIPDHYPVLRTRKSDRRSNMPDMSPEDPTGGEPPI